MASEYSDDGSDQQSERCGSYSLSADVSESESCSSFSCRRFDGEGCSSSMTSSPRLMAAGGFGFQVPVIGGKDVVIWDDDDEKTEKRDTDLSGISGFFTYF
ncbi:ROP (rho of plants) guanine nucleotide exchange factor 1 [Hibiscus trionum]|uniref:ROP (Rho of plants) guanine nucleotide exchange factor 1 n=1 Tax=Hibiscus trionum TaxID=183268 RepID=A0A9W7H246_HIBTR|nr:ROP (rho of plants) guanine nucleotide exchange factor 1 [Hibiscus trionum]